MLNLAKVHYNEKLFTPYGNPGFLSPVHSIKNKLKSTLKKIKTNHY